MGNVVYKIRFRDGDPYVAIGDVYETGKIKKTRRVNERRGESGQNIRGWSESIDRALDRELEWWCNHFSPAAMAFLPAIKNNRGDLTLRDLEGQICALRRLRRKLQKHGLLPPRRE